MKNNSHKDIQDKLKFKDIEKDSRGYENFFARNKEYIICIIIIFIMLIGIIIGIKILSVSVPNTEEVKILLLGKEININDNVYIITEDNLEDVKIINRVTKKDELDNVDLKLVLNIDGIIYEAKGSVEFSYDGSEWKYSASNKFNKISKDYTGVDFNEVITKYIKENGITDNTGKLIPRSFISKVGKINFKGNSYKEDREFEVDIILSNGICSQECTVNGETSLNKDNFNWNIINLNVYIKDKVIRNKEINEDEIKKQVLGEILTGGIFKIDNSLVITDEVLNISNEDILEFNISEYIVREDNSIRALVSGKIKYNNEEVPFEGLVIVTGKLSDGELGNSKDITLFETEPIQYDEYEEGLEDPNSI